MRARGTRFVRVRRLRSGKYGGVSSRSFDTGARGARLWELAPGGAPAIVLPALRPPRPVRLALGWLGRAALVSCGLPLQVSTVFPGYAALWPTVAALMVIVAGTSGSRLGARPAGRHRVAGGRRLHRLAG